MEGLRFQKCNEKTTLKDKNKFDCGHSLLNNYLKDNFLKNIKNGSYGGGIIIDETKEDKVVAFFSVSGMHLIFDDYTYLKNAADQKLPKKIPILKLWMIAVDKSYQSQGIGKFLMREVFLMSIRISSESGCIAVCLDAAEHSIPFYESLGFLKLQEEKNEDGSLPMFILTGTLKASLK